jgi:F-type H+-transporting ATPase subunit b
MDSLIATFGLDWKLLLAQGINFFVLLVALRYFAYGPILAILAERKKKIEAGLAMAKESETRLGEVGLIVKDKLENADTEALQIIKATEERAKALEATLLVHAHEKEAEIIKNAERMREAQSEEARKTLEREARVLVRSAIEKTVELSPAAIDDALITKALRELHHTA